jgi:hypothetical protein
MRRSMRPEGRINTKDKGSETGSDASKASKEWWTYLEHRTLRSL